MARPWLLLAALALPLAACDLPSSSSVSMRVQFNGNHQLNADGTCLVQFAAAAFGVGTLTWQRVTIYESETTVDDFVGAETAEFWGDDEIRAGQQQVSIAFSTPSAGTTTRVRIEYSTAKGDGTTTLRPVCD